MLVAALEGLKVVDLTRTVAGPFCTQLLGDMGAEVVKIEEPSHGDETRGWGPYWGNLGVQFIAFNRNKRSVALNLKDKRAVEICLKLAEDADVMIESFRAGTANKMGIGYEAVAAINPRIVYCSISGFGRTGPMAARPGYDLILQGYGGMMSTTGEPGRPPVRIGYSIVDIFAGMAAYGAITTALIARGKTGKGQWVESSLLDGQVAAMSYHAVGYLATGRVSGRLGSAHPVIAPYQVFDSSDGHFILGCANDGLWRRFCPAIGLPALTEDVRFITNTDRVEHRDDLASILSEHFRTKTKSEWVDMIAEAGVPCGPINSVDDVINDPQVEARGMIVPLNHPRVPDMKAPGSPIRLADMPASVRRPPADLGEHTQEVLCELGYSQQEIVRLKNEGVT